MHRSRFLQSLFAGKGKGLTIILISAPVHLAIGATSLIIPLYMYSVLKSETVISHLLTAREFVLIFALILFSYMLSRLSRFSVFIIALILAISGIFIIVYYQNFLGILLAKSLHSAFQVLFWGVLVLCLRDATSDQEKLRSYNGINAATANFMHIISPAMAGYLMHYFDQDTTLKTELRSRDFVITADLASYQIPLLLALLPLVLSLGIVVWRKLSNTDIFPKPAGPAKPKGEANTSLLFRLSVARQFFQNQDRIFAFACSFIMNSWNIVTRIFFSILLKKHGASLQEIGIFISLMQLLETVSDLAFKSMIKRFKGIMNLLIGGYLFVLFFLTIASLTGFDNIYLYASIFIIAQTGTSVCDPLTSQFFYRGTSKENEERYYMFLPFAGAIAYLAVPVALGQIISYWDIETLFTYLPVMIIIFLAIIFEIQRLIRKQAVKETS